MEILASDDVVVGKAIAAEAVKAAAQAEEGCIPYWHSTLL